MAGEAATALRGDDVSVLGADQTDLWHAFLRFKRQHHPFLQGFIESLGQDGRFVDLQPHAVPQETRPPGAIAHEVLQKIRVEAGHEAR